jgi:hypothetical protein
MGCYFNPHGTKIAERRRTTKTAEEKPLTIKLVPANPGNFWGEPGVPIREN